MQGFKDTPSKHNGVKPSRGMEKRTREGYSKNNEGVARGHQGDIKGRPMRNATNCANCGYNTKFRIIPRTAGPTPRKQQHHRVPQCVVTVTLGQ